MTKTSRAFIQNLLLLTGSVVFAAILAEVALRLLLPAPVTWTFPQESYVYDSEVGHWLTPNQQAFTHDKPVRINSLGIRGSEYSSNASLGVYRILALGDSQTFGNGLDEGDTWPKQLEAKLNQRSKEAKYEVLNGGIPATDTWQHEIILRRLLASYHPDIVVLAFYVNDVSRKFTPTPTSHQISNTLKQRIGYLLKQSALLLSLRAATDSLQHTLSPKTKFSQEMAVAGGSHSRRSGESWAQVQKSLSAMKTMCETQKVPFILAALPRRDQIDGRLPWDTYFKQLRTIADQHAITLISTYSPLQQAHKAYGDALFIPWDGHNSKLANRIIAQEIEQEVTAVTEAEQVAAFSTKTSVPLKSVRSP